MSDRTSRILLLVFAVAHFVFALMFAFSTPYRQSGILMGSRDPSTGQRQRVVDIGAPDERQHANYVRHLVQQKSLPVFDPKSPTLGEDYQFHQPPLYYAVTAAAETVAGQSDPESQAFGKVGRILNALIGTLGIFGVFFAGLWATKNRGLALASTAFAALLPMNCALSGTMSNDPLLICLISWGFALLARSLSEEEIKAKWLLGAAVISGLACLTKSSGLILMVGLFCTAFLVRKRVPLNVLAGTLGLAVLMVLPIWMRNQSLYGDPLAQKAFKEAFVGSAQKQMIVAGIEASNAAGSPEIQYWINWVGYWTFRSYFGVFGYMDIWLNETGRANSDAPNLLYKAWMAFALLGGFAFLAKWRKEKITQALGIALILAIITKVLFVGFNMTYFQAQGRYLLPSIAATGVILATGWSYLVKERIGIVIATISIFFGGATIYALSKLPAEFKERIEVAQSP